MDRVRVDPTVAGETGDALGPDLTKREIIDDFGIVVNLACIGIAAGGHETAHAKATMRAYGASTKIRGSDLEFRMEDAQKMTFLRYCFECSFSGCGRKMWLVIPANSSEVPVPVPENVKGES